MFKSFHIGPFPQNDAMLLTQKLQPLFGWMVWWAPLPDDLRDDVSNAKTGSRHMAQPTANLRPQGVVPHLAGGDETIWTFGAW